MLATRGAWRWRGISQRPLLASLVSAPSPPSTAGGHVDALRYCSVRISGGPAFANVPAQLNFAGRHRQIRTVLSSSSFSALPPDEEEKEKDRVGSLTPYQKEMELRELDAKLARLQTLRGINTGELYTFRGKFKMLSRDYGMGFLAWYWTCWFATAGLSYAAIELGGVDPLAVAAKIETLVGLEPCAITGRLDPTLGEVALVVAANECLEPLRLPFVVVTTKPVVNFFSKSSHV